MSKTKAVKDAKRKKKGLYARLDYPQKRAFWGVILLMPWLFGLIFFFLAPLFQTFYYAFFEMTLGNDGFGFNFTGFGNFIYILTVDPDFNQELITALTEVVSNVPIQIFMSLFVAMMLNGSYKGRGLFRVIFFIPIILATGITSLELRDLNIAEDTARSIVDMQFMTDIFAGSMPASIMTFINTLVNTIFTVVTTSGVQTLIFLAGLQGISPTLYEVAKIEGCTQFESFCKITLPMISPMIVVCMVYSIADTFASADISETINETTFTMARYGMGASMSALYFLVSVLVTLILVGIVSKVVFYYDN